MAASWRPAHRNFRSAQAVALGEEQNFGVEAKAFDALLLENPPRTLADENLEPALRVMKLQTGESAHKTIKDHPGEFAHARLAAEDERAVERARTDGGVIPDLNRDQKFFEFLDGRGEVGIGEQRKAAAGFEHAMAYAVPFSAIVAIRDQAEQRHGARPFLDDARSPIRGAIIHHQHFDSVERKWRPRVGKIIADTAERAGQARLFVVRGNHNGKLGS